MKITWLALEVLLLLAILAGVRHQLTREIDAEIRRNRAIGEAIGRHAGEFFRELEKSDGAFDLRALHDYLNGRLGRSKLFEEDSRWVGAFEVYRIKDLKLGRIRPEILSAVDFSAPFTVQEEGEQLAVTIPFALAQAAEPYGVVRIRTPFLRLYANLLERNVGLYLTTLFLFGAQLVLCYLLLARRRREIFFEKGYLREHALGALKLQRQILDGIIADHEGLNDSDHPGAAAHEGAGEPSSKVVRLDEKVRSKSRQT